jgi:hypothetical protein
LAFLDTDDVATSAGGPQPPRRQMPDRQRQIVVRRAVGVGVLVLLLILIVLGIRGCLNARKQRSFENYASDLNTIAAQTSQLSQDFFQHLNDPGNLSPLSFEAQIDSYAGTAGELETRVRSLDTPGDLKDAQSHLNQAYELRADGMSGIAKQTKTALGNQGAAEADRAIADYMRYFLASDVLYSRAQAQIDAELQDEEIDAQAPDSEFLPEPVADWLDPLKVSADLAQVSGGKAATTGTHGLGLLQTTIKPGNQVLDPSTPATISGGGPPEVDVQVQNQGDQEETDVAVSIELTGGTETITGDATVPRISPGAIQTASIPLQPSPETGKELTLEVTVQPVPGEQVESNNRSTYHLTFQ